MHRHTLVDTGRSACRPAGRIKNLHVDWLALGASREQPLLRPGQPPRAVLAIQLFLLAEPDLAADPGASADPRVVLERSYTLSEPVAGQDAEALVRALDTALAKALDAFISDAATTLNF